MVNEVINEVLKKERSEALDPIKQNSFSENSLGDCFVVILSWDFFM